MFLSMLKVKNNPGCGDVICQWNAGKLSQVVLCPGRRAQNLSVENCTAKVLDGASNICGQYKGVSTRLKEDVPNHIHTWCATHNLNLVVTDIS